MSCVSSSVVYGDTFTEVGDAGGLPATADLTAGAGVGALTAIEGILSPDSGDVADMFEIFLTDGVTFSATTVGGAGFDTELFLFDSAGLVFMPKTNVSGFRAPQLCQRVTITRRPCPASTSWRSHSAVLSQPTVVD